MARGRVRAYASDLHRRSSASPYTWQLRLRCGRRVFVLRRSSFSTLQPETLALKLAAQVQYLATGEAGHEHTLKAQELQPLLEQLISQLQALPEALEDYRPQENEPTYQSEIGFVSSPASLVQAKHPGSESSVRIRPTRYFTSTLLRCQRGHRNGPGKGRGRVRSPRAAGTEEGVTAGRLRCPVFASSTATCRNTISE